MDMIRFNQSPSCLHEAEHITMFLVEMSVYRKEWQLALPDAFQQILFSSTVLLDTCVSLLIRPRLLAYVIEVGEISNTSQSLVVYAWWSRDWTIPICAPYRSPLYRGTPVPPPGNIDRVVWGKSHTDPDLHSCCALWSDMSHTLTARGAFSKTFDSGWVCLLRNSARFSAASKGRLRANNRTRRRIILYFCLNTTGHSILIVLQCKIFLSLAFDVSTSSLNSC